MSKRQLIPAFVLAALMAILVLMAYRCEEIPVVRQVEEAGIKVNYTEFTTLNEPCHPEDWEGLVEFELRSGSMVVSTQAVGTDCKVVCDRTAAPCEDVLVPGTWPVPVPDGDYQLWWRGGWRNLKDGRFVLSHPAELQDYEDERGFIHLGKAILQANALIFLPMVVRESR